MTSQTTYLDSFRHEALFYDNDQEFLDGTTPFIRGGVDAGEPILVVVDCRKIQLLTDELGDASEKVHFADMAEVGHNPARIIPVWHDFLSAHGGGGQTIRGIGEPIWATRSQAELVECERHEALLNLAFEGSQGFWLLCPYDTSNLTQDVLFEAKKNHPYVAEGGDHQASKTFVGLEKVARPFDHPLQDPPLGSVQMAFAAGHLEAVRRFVHMDAAGQGMSPQRIDDLVLVVNELAANSIRHGGGSGVLKMWREGDYVVCEVSDRGRIDKPLAGRERPVADQEGGFGLWLVNQLSDLVQLRTFDIGSVARIHFRL